MKRQTVGDMRSAITSQHLSDAQVRKKFLNFRARSLDELSEIIHGLKEYRPDLLSRLSEEYAPHRT